jgi:DNA repair protein RadC
MQEPEPRRRDRYDELLETCGLYSDPTDRALFLNRRNHLIADEVLGEGTFDHAPVYPREVVRRALQLDACGVVLVHNHPSGDDNPSRADVEVTAIVIEACRGLRITVHDHLLVAGQQVISFKARGLI